MHPVSEVSSDRPLASRSSRQPFLCRLPRRFLLGGALEDQILRHMTAASLVAVAVVTNGGRVARQVELIKIGLGDRARYVRIHPVFFVDDHAFGYAPGAIALLEQVQGDAPGL